MSFLFQELCRENIETFKKYNVKKDCDGLSAYV